ncbi:MAG: Ig-like domain-containing protein, partial [Isosphaeraceae bacterium]
MVEHLEDRRLLASIAEFSGLASGSAPQSITPGPDGNLWFTEPGLDKIGRMDPAGGLTEFSLLPGSQPTSITAGPDGNLWYTATGTDKIGMITPLGLITEYSVITSLSSPQGIAAGPDGNLWFTETGANQIGMITTGGLVTEYGGLTANSQPSGITSGPDGNLWFTQIGTNSIGSIVPSGPNIGTIAEYVLPIGNTPGSITTGPDGNLWFTAPNGNSIGQITTTGVITEFPVLPSDFGPQQIIAGPGGDLYFTTSTGNTIGRINTSGTFVGSYSVPTSASNPAGITVGPDGHILFTEATGNQIGRLNLEPFAVSDSYPVNQDSSLSVNAASGVLANDGDPEGDTITAFPMSSPSHGNVALNLDGSFTYTPNSGYFGPDSFTYMVGDGVELSALATVNITVNGLPISTDDSYTVGQDTILNVNAANGVLANDSDPDSDPITANLLALPSHGTLTLNPDGSFTYTPDTGYAGPDAFAYLANDGSTDGNLTSVNIKVNAPPVGVNDSYTVNQDDLLLVDDTNGVLANDTDANSDVLTAAVIDSPLHGSLTLTPNGSFLYIPNVGYFGPDSFTYKANDGNADSNTTTVNIKVNAPPVSLDDSFSTAKNLPLTIGGPGVLANDSDPNGDSMTSVLVTNPTNGSLTLYPNGSFIYSPNLGYQGTDSFTYKANDGGAGGNT